jgi:hypothetical protein
MFVRGFSMKTTLLGFLVVALTMIPTLSHAADVSELNGTWSGSWLPKGGVVDAVTVEIRQEDGKLTGRFRTPQEMTFSTATFDSKTGNVVLEATDSKSGKHYKINGKLDKLEIKGTLAAGETTGDVLLIKWTYVPR